MTVMAQTSAPLKRLFARLVYAMPPCEESLANVFDRWNAATKGATMPRAVSLGESPGIFQNSFICQRSERGRDYVIVDGHAAAKVLLGGLEAADVFKRRQSRQTAVRVRRLVEEATRCATPFVAQYDAMEKGVNKKMVEVLLAPLSDDGKTVGAVLVSFLVKSYAEAAAPFPRRKSLDEGPSVFCLDQNKSFGERISDYINVDLTPHEERVFEDGEFKIRPLRNVRNKDVYVLSSLHGAEHVGGAPSLSSASEKLCRLLFFIGALKDAGTGRICVVAPYLCFQRKDRQTKSRDPITSRYLAQLIEAMGTDLLITMDAHNIAAFQNAFRCDTEHLDARGIFASSFAPLVGQEPVAVVSPDLGGEKRAELFRERFERVLGRPVEKAFMDKRRSEGEVTGEIFAGDVKGRIAIVLDDLIAGGGTMARVAQACRKHGAKQVWCAATHGVFSRGAAKTLEGAPIDRIVVTDTVPLPNFMRTPGLKNRVSVVSAAPLFAQAIERCHNGGSITKLLDDEN